MADNIMDYIVDQADRYDNDNIQYEKDIIFKINRKVDSMISECFIWASPINSVLQMEQLLDRINNVISRYISEIKIILSDVANKYSNMAYDNVGDLIDMWKEISSKFDESVMEQKVEYDDDMIEYIQRYSFDLLTGYSNNKINELRSKLGYSLLTGNCGKPEVRQIIEKVLNTNKSKAEEIAQSELSMAYNHGTLKRMNEFKRVSGKNIRKYWHGFKYSANTCEYCRDRIGSVYDLDDDSESLPAHVRCRCVWLPIVEDWDNPVTNKLIAKANILNTAYSEEMLYNRINKRLNIDYAKYLSKEEAIDFISGDRTTRMGDAIKNARNRYISDKIDQFDIKTDNSNGKMSRKYNEQIKFWKRYVAEAMADKDYILLSNCKEAIKGIMLLPWTAEQLAGWDKLISNI